MKVGVLTFHCGPNYGGHFQALCLTQAIAGLGHQVEVIHYKNNAHYKNELFRPARYRRPSKLWHDWQKHRIFKRALGQLPLSHERVVRSPREIDWNRYDAIVIGSDIVWNRDMERLGCDDAYFGRFPTAFSGRLIAYAPSIGPMDPNHRVPDWMEEALQRFHFIGVRDVNTARFVQLHTGERPPIVADPTWLVDPVSARSESEKKGMLVYSFPLTGKYSGYVDSIKKFAREMNVEIDAIGYHQSWCDRNIRPMDVDRWQNMFGEYRYVVSGTFHGGLFAIREKAQFCILSHPTIDPKLDKSLERTGLADRLINDPDDLIPVLSKEVDYDRVTERRLDYSHSSLKLLSDALS